MEYYNLSKEDVINHLKTHETHGLDNKAVAQLHQTFGSNRLNEKKKKTNFQRFCDQFKDAMILILIAAAAVSFVIACMEGNPRDFLNRH